MNRMVFGIIALLGIGGCSTQNPTPDQIRQNTAKATSEVVRDTKAVAKGVADGIKQQAGHRIDINKASVGELETLPGLDNARARKIIDQRPYSDTSDLIKKHVVSGAEYDRISDKITAQ